MKTSSWKDKLKGKSARARTLLKNYINPKASLAQQNQGVMTISS